MFYEWNNAKQIFITFWSHARKYFLPIIFHSLVLSHTYRLRDDYETMKHYNCTYFMIFEKLATQPLLHTNVYAEVISWHPVHEMHEIKLRVK
jgi:hypothetical protein